MMGITHATSGAAAWIAITSTMPALSLGAYPLDPVGVLVGTAVCAGAALLPDADHHSATIAQAVPVLGRLTAATIGTLSGGHRHGAHSPIALAIVAAGAWALTLLTLATEELGVIAIGVDPPAGGPQQRLHRIERRGDGRRERVDRSQRDGEHQPHGHDGSGLPAAEEHLHRHGEGEHPEDRHDLPPHEPERHPGEHEEPDDEHGCPAQHHERTLQCDDGDEHREQAEFRERRRAVHERGAGMEDADHVRPLTR